jgi:hypothetical protein
MEGATTTPRSFEHLREHSIGLWLSARRADKLRDVEHVYVDDEAGTTLEHA